MKYTIVKLICNYIINIYFTFYLGPHDTVRIAIQVQKKTFHLEKGRSRRSLVPRQKIPLARKKYYSKTVLTASSLSPPPACGPFSGMS